jgi:hypothetical protein
MPVSGALDDQLESGVMYRTPLVGLYYVTLYASTGYFQQLGRERK